MIKKSLTKELKNDNVKYYVEMGIDFDKRIIFIDDDIEDIVVGQVIRAIHKMRDKDSVKPITVFINSGGGLVSSGLALYDSLRSIGVLIHTIAIGRVCSMGLVLFLAGDKRFAYDNVRFLHHESSAYTRGKTSEILDDLQEIKVLEAICDKIIAIRTDKTVKWWKNKCHKKEFWFGKKEALEYGVLTQSEVELE